MSEVIIIEDERLSAERLKDLINECDPEMRISALIPSVDKALEWFRDNSPPDLIFLDIQLSDGTGFDIIKALDLCPAVIITTAYDDYALKAFKFNSIDYLLKPIERDVLQLAIDKYKSQEIGFTEQKSSAYDQPDRIFTKDYKRRFLVKLGEQFQNVDVADIAYFSYESGMTYLITSEGKKLPLDHSLDQLEDVLDPMDFFRINRQFLVNVKSVLQIHTYFNSRLLLRLSPLFQGDVIVSRDRVTDFKRWMDC